ncbi:three-Cys-motif partner protein TcmP [Rhodococcus sp. 1R11]|uniref:three-Cys-motif partner protein TcmP n=1 Tax=Rhodococcus sp. 1R11 TaxID=2559614 RepID=UPI001071CAA4|nr:three-Cys-motif partner protein TcmP [Rhodococcus sp. 1R11]TFI45020.1 three-Cys-motif partner protein TcmP [Rhodococcus sp. 1R11]
MPAKADNDPAKWQMEPHTKAKHDILNNYLGAWFPILSSRRGRVLYIDGFAGRGRYGDGSEGSPQIAIRRLLSHHFLPQMSDCEFVFYFLEKNADNCEALEKELDALELEIGPYPSNLKINIINGSFDTEMAKLFELVKQQNTRLAPTFAFIDPFGYTRFPMSVLADIASTPKSELFINFMVGSVQRWITRDKQQDAIRALYGKEVAEVVTGMEASPDRIGHLVGVYASALRDETSLPYILRFDMLNNTGNVSYSLIHASGSELGVQRMKSAMWKVDPGGTYKFSDRTHGLPVLFAASPDTSPLRSLLLKKFSGRSGVTKKDIHRFTILETNFREVHATPFLKQFEQEGLITVHRPYKKTQFSDGVTFDFT